jgi:hypothetical protein
VEVKVLDIMTLDDIPSIQSTGQQQQQEIHNEQLEHRIDEIRAVMTKEGNMHLSRVENRSCKSIKTMIQAPKH